MIGLIKTALKRVELKDLPEISKDKPWCLFVWGHRVRCFQTEKDASSYVKVFEVITDWRVLLSFILLLSAIIVLVVRKSRQSKREKEYVEKLLHPEKGTPKSPIKTEIPVGEAEKLSFLAKNLLGRLKLGLETRSKVNDLNSLLEDAVGAVAAVVDPKARAAFSKALDAFSAKVKELSTNYTSDLSKIEEILNKSAVDQGGEEETLSGQLRLVKFEKALTGEFGVDWVAHIYWEALPRVYHIIQSFLESEKTSLSSLIEMRESEENKLEEERKEIPTVFDRFPEGIPGIERTLDTLLSYEQNKFQTFLVQRKEELSGQLKDKLTWLLQGIQSAKNALLTLRPLPPEHPTDTGSRGIPGTGRMRLELTKRIHELSSYRDAILEELRSEKLFSSELDRLRLDLDMKKETLLSDLAVARGFTVEEWEVKAKRLPTLSLELEKTKDSLSFLHSQESKIEGRLQEISDKLKDIQARTVAIAHTLKVASLLDWSVSEWFDNPEGKPYCLVRKNKTRIKCFENETYPKAIAGIFNTLTDLRLLSAFTITVLFAYLLHVRSIGKLKRELGGMKTDLEVAKKLNQAQESRIEVLKKNVIVKEDIISKAMAQAEQRRIQSLKSSYDALYVLLQDLTPDGRGKTTVTDPRFARERLKIIKNQFPGTSSNLIEILDDIGTRIRTL